MNPVRFDGRLAIIQRVLPAYRAPFFEALSDHCAGGAALLAGQPRPDESIATLEKLERARFYPVKNIHLSSTSSRFYFCYQLGLINWLKEWNPDALIVEANSRYLSSPAAMRWMHARQRPVIGWGLGAPRNSLPVRAFLKQFDALLAYSQRGAQQYAACGYPLDKIFVAHNAVAPAPVEPFFVRPDGFVDRPSLLFVGRLQARKRIPALLRACAGLPEQLKPRLVIVGDGPESAGLRSIAREVYPAAEFVGAKLGPQLDLYFKAADLFVLPGTGGLAVQQAMSFGLPVIVAQGDGTQDDLVRAGNGWQIPPDDDEALAACLRLALADVAKLRAMGAESYRIVAQEINLEHMVSVFVEALNSLKA